MTTPAEEPGPPQLDTPPEPGTVPEQETPPERRMRRVGLWGATASGKSTFLSSLFIAAMRSSVELRVRGNNGASTDFLVRNTHILNAEHRFPPPTITQEPLNWTLQMTVPNRTRRRLRRGPDRVPFDFRIDLQDAPGRTFAAVPEAEPSRIDIGDDDGDEAAQVAAYLATCQGLILLVDPVRERELGDAHEYFHGTLLRIAQRVETQLGRRLPHYVAVCVTKFDDPSVFRSAMDNEFLSYRVDDPLMFPRVHDKQAKQFMEQLFVGSQLSDVALMQGALRQYFYPERIQYFVTSAVGFYVGSSGEFQENDFANVVQGTDGQHQIRGQLHPINVAEPLLWLGEKIAAEG